MQMKRLNHTGDGGGDSTGARLACTSYRAAIAGKIGTFCRCYVRLYITCWFDVFHLGLNAAKKKLPIAWSKAGGIKQVSALMSAQRMILLERFHSSNIILKTTKFFLVFRA